MTDEALVVRALEARENSYTPYSHFKVGAALLTKEGKVYEGCNIENAGYTPTNCAERTAFFNAVSQGERNFAKIAVAGSPEGEITQMAAPCGVCRQVMMEFCDPEEFEILMIQPGHTFQKILLKDLLPFGFGPENLKN